MSDVRERLDALWAGSLTLRELRYELQNDPHQLDVLDDDEMGRLYRSAQLGRYSLQELCRVLERRMAVRPLAEKGNNDDNQDDNEARCEADRTVRR